MYMYICVICIHKYNAIQHKNAFQYINKISVTHPVADPGFPIGGFLYVEMKESGPLVCARHALSISSMTSVTNIS